MGDCYSRSNVDDWLIEYKEKIDNKRLIKFLLVGEVGCGKKKLIRRYAYGNYDESEIPKEDKFLKLQICNDTNLIIMERSHQGNYFLSIYLSIYPR